MFKHRNFVTTPRHWNTVSGRFGSVSAITIRNCKIPKVHLFGGFHFGGKSALSAKLPPGFAAVSYA